MSAVIPVTNNAYQHRKRLVRAASLHWFHWLIIMFSLVLTIGAWYFSKEQIREKISNQFERDADQAIELVKERMALYETVLWGAAALYESSEDVTYKEWKRYTRSIRIDKKYPGINGIGVIHHVRRWELEAYLSRQRNWQPDFAIHPEHDKNEYWPITYVEPEGINKKAIGLDVCFEENRCAGVKKARDTGQAQLTAPIILVQDSKNTPSFLFLTPFYRGRVKPQNIDERRDKIEGVVSVPFMMPKLMLGTLDKKSRDVGIKISDDGELLYDDNAQGDRSGYDQNPLFRKTAEIPMYGRTWTFDVWSNLFFRESAHSNQPHIILVGGILIDLLLLGWFIFLSRANRTALSYADQVTAELQVEAVQLEKTIVDLEDARQRADVANAAKSDFLANMSHELRTPLNSIQLLSQALINTSDKKIGSTQKEYAEVIFDSSRNLNGLIDDILDLSKVEAGKMDIDLSECSVDGIVNDMKDSFSALALQGGLIFRAEISGAFPVRFYSDYKRLRQILVNLLSNAFKFTHSGSVTLRLERVDQGSGYCCNTNSCHGGSYLALSVEDTGIGMTPEIQKNIFDEFVQADSSVSRKYEGTGLGLAIAKKMSALLGGKVHFTSEEGKGSIFTLVIPENIAV